MIDDATYEVLRQGFEVLFLACVPVVAVTAIAGLLFAILQSATSIHDSASAYAVRLIAVCCVIYVIAQSVSLNLMAFFQLAFSNLGGIH